MRNAETVLGIIHERGKRGLPIEDVYRQLYNPDLYLRAYSRIYRNDGAMTRGIDEETVDGMSLKKIKGIIEKIRYERFQWTPVRRTYIAKKNGKRRPLGIPSWSEKLVQEVIRSILEAYYEPQFNDLSHGFRPKRGCHTALRKVQTWGGVTWFIEGDIKGCFDNIDHDILISILRENIHDNRFIRLLENLLKAGYLEEWEYKPTLSGTPQGGICSPVLCNIYLNKLDKFVENELLPRFTKGKHRKPNRKYAYLNWKSWYLRKKGDIAQAAEVRKMMHRLPSKASCDPDFRRLGYVRYADDFLLGFTGPKKEAKAIKQLLREFLANELKLELSEDKTLITHAITGPASFLGYEIKQFLSDTKHDKRGHRSVNGKMNLRVPKDKVTEICNLYMRRGKAMHRPELINDSDYTIISTYQSHYRGLVQYYVLAHNISVLDKVRWVLETSLLKTLAGKFRASVNRIAKRYKSTVQTSNGPRRCIEVTIKRQGKKPLVARFGGIPLRRKPWAVIVDKPPMIYRFGRTELLKRMLADACEICNSTKNVEVHHIRKLADVNPKGRKAKPLWMQIMAARQRKTLVVCRSCHRNIHMGCISQKLQNG